jgi:hypothetical protein
LINNVDDYIHNNRATICASPTYAAVYDQLLKPSGVCWRAGMSGRSSLYAHHSDYGTKTTLIEEGTGHWRGERETSPFAAARERLRSNATLLQMAASGNYSAHELFLDPFQTYCALSGGTNCERIGKERCTCYCVQPGTCTSVMAAKYAKAAVAILEMALDVVAAVCTGGTSVVAKAGAKAAAKAALKAAAKKAAQSGGKVLMKKAPALAAKLGVKAGAKQSVKNRLRKQVAKDFTKEWAVMSTKDKIKATVKAKVKGAIKGALKKAACENLVDAAFDEGINDPEWASSPSFKWGNHQGPAGFLSTVDISGVVGLVGIFHEADCPTEVPGEPDGESCPR